MTEPSSESPADDEQGKPGLLDRILGRSEGAHRGPAEEEVAEQEERAEEQEEQATEEQPAQDTGAATRRDESEDDAGSDGAEEHDDLDADAEGQPSVGAMPSADEVDQDAIEEDRAQRLDPENRPENVEIDNTQRDFDSEKGMFTDAEGYEDAEKKYDDDAF